MSDLKPAPETTDPHHTAPPSTTSPQAAPPPRRRILDLSMTQVAAGSAAAATAAYLGSTLGVVGTILGAAVASVISAIATSVYGTSMRHLHASLRRSRGSATLDGRSTPRPYAGPAGPRDDGTGPLATPSPSGWREPLPVVTARAGQRGRIRPRHVLATSGLLFVVAGAFLTGLQLASGTDVTGTDLGTRVARDVVHSPAPTRSEKEPATAPTTVPVPAPTEPVPTPAPSETTPPAPTTPTTPETTAPPAPTEPAPNEPPAATPDTPTTPPGPPTTPPPDPTGTATP